MSDTDETQLYPGQTKRQGNDSAPSMPIDIPDVEVEAVIGKGASGIVYRGRQSYLDRAVAVKVLNAATPGGESEFNERFKREARLLANLEHPNIVTCYQAGVCLDQRSFIIMEYVDGPTLKEFIDQHGPLPVPIAVNIIQKVSEALKYAYHHKIIHRDIKAENVLLKLDTQGLSNNFRFSPKLADLGIARSVELDPDSDLTSVGTLVGTPSFMAPEQFNAPDKVGFAADIYGLGCMLYFLLTGQKPFTDRDLMQLLAKKINADYPDPQQLNPKIDTHTKALVADMLRADIAARPKSYDALIARCQTVPSKTQTKQQQPATKSDKTALLLAIIGVAILVSVAVIAWQSNTQTAQPPVASAPAPSKTPEKPPTKKEPQQASAPKTPKNTVQVAAPTESLPEDTPAITQRRTNITFSSDAKTLFSSDFQAPLRGWGERKGSASWIAEDEGQGINAIGTGEQFYITTKPPWRVEGSVAMLTNASKEAGIKLIGVDGHYVLVSLQQLGNIYLSVASGRTIPSGDASDTRNPIEFIPLDIKPFEHVKFSIIADDDLLEIAINDRFVGSVQLGFAIQTFALLVDQSTASFRNFRLISQEK